MNKTRLSVPKMDSGPEIIRVALEVSRQVRRAWTDLNAREVLVVHENRADEVAALIRSLRLGGEILETGDASGLDETDAPSTADEVRMVRVVLTINAGVFVVEALAAVVADSSALTERHRSVLCCPGRHRNRSGE